MNETRLTNREYDLPYVKWHY